ncbi:hypothetical protein BDV12DRAFT_12228 [Aspergillus spectabilis]
MLLLVSGGAGGVLRGETVETVETVNDTDACRCRMSCLSGDVGCGCRTPLGSREERRVEKILKVGYRGVWRVLGYVREGDGEVPVRRGIGPGADDDGEPTVGSGTNGYLIWLSQPHFQGIIMPRSSILTIIRASQC